MDGTLGNVEASQNYELVIKEFSLPVEYEDERLTGQANRMMIEEGDVSRKAKKSLIKSCNDDFAKLFR